MPGGNMNYENMTDDNIRNEIARRKGWNYGQVGEHYGANNERIPVMGWTRGGYIVYDPPDWLTDISAAWGLVQELKPHFFQVHVMCWDHTDKWVCQADSRHGHDEPKKWIAGEGPTASRAICIAWLIANDSSSHE